MNKYLLLCLKIKETYLRVINLVRDFLFLHVLVVDVEEIILDITLNEICMNREQIDQIGI